MNVLEKIDSILRVKISKTPRALTLQYREEKTDLAISELKSTDEDWELSQIAFAFKLAIDRKVDPYNVKTERQQKKKARNIYELVSPYGTRIPMLISDITKSFAEKWIGEALLYQPFLGDESYGFVYREDTRRGIHVLSEGDLLEMAFSQENIISFANYTILNEGHKIKKKEECLQFTSSDFRITGLLSAFPDFVYDIAKKKAYAYIASPNRITILPAYSLLDAKAHFQLAQVDSPLPWCKDLFHLDGENFKRITY